MNKLYVATAIAFASIAFASAEDGVKNQAPARPPMMRPVGAPEVRPQITTGDANVDAQVKVLAKEMEDKMQAIRVEYMAKIQAIIGSLPARAGKKVTPSSASTTPFGMTRGEKRGAEEGNKIGRPMMGSTTLGTTTSSVRRGDDFQREIQVDGTSTLNVKEKMQGVGLRMQNFFRGFFGRNN